MQECSNSNSKQENNKKKSVVLKNPVGKCFVLYFTNLKNTEDYYFEKERKVAWESRNTLRYFMRIEDEFFVKVSIFSFQNEYNLLDDLVSKLQLHHLLYVAIYVPC